jgi:hypothetical protein
MMKTAASLPPLDAERLEFPQVLVPYVGLSNREIAFMKKKGCPFWGRKTTLKWVRQFIAREAGAVY